MGIIQEMLNQKWFLPAIAVALVIGIGLGVLYAWVINPVEWVDGEPHQLRQDLQEDYLRMVIESYTVNRDAQLAVTRYERLGSERAAVLDGVAEEPEGVSPTAIQSFRALIEIEEGAAEQVEEEAGPGPSIFSRLVLPACGATLLIGLILGLVLFFRNRSMAEEDDLQVEPEWEAGYVGSPVQPEPTHETPVVQPEALATFRTIYTLGDDLYDDSFSIESPSGDFLGECGVGIGDVIGMGDPNKVSAFEVWLFDKNDIQTVTKVLMSAYSYYDDATRNRLAAKGDPVLAEPGGIVELETASLAIEARIVDMTYGEGALPDESFFERVTIELRAWPKA